MYRVLIVDDETYVVDWLSALIESRVKPEMDVCRAYSAAEALGWLNRAKIDIVITDICMPEISGIELAKKVRLNWPYCKVILLTGHAKFDYAYEAIRDNVFSYILKTEDDEHILAEVNKTVAQLDREFENSELLEQVQDQLKDSAAVIRNQIILAILNGEYKNPAELLKQLKNVDPELFMERPFIMFLGRIEKELSNFDILEEYRRVNSIRSIAEQYFGGYFSCRCVEYAMNKMVWLIQLKSDGGPDSRENVLAISGHETIFVTGMLETVQQAYMEGTGIPVSFVLHGSMFSAGQLSEYFRSLNRLMDIYAPDDEGFVITDTGSTFPASDKTFGDDLYPNGNAISNIAVKLRTCLENKRREEYMACLENVAAWLNPCTVWENNVAMEIYFTAASAVISYINQRKLAEKIALKVGLNELFQPWLEDSWAGAARYLRRISEVLFDLQKDSNGLISDNIVCMLRNYICDHLTEDISLVRLSEVSGYNASYLSRLYKRQTGETLNDYIRRQKLNKIKDLLSDKRITIGDAAIRAGFDSRTYFNRFVKKATGMAPQEYRNHILHG